jgi:hypothetical protein
MKSIVARFKGRFFRKGEIGQSIVILALGFIGLLAVVGITTDVSVLFVRFSQLRRAVDSAAIAAAGQMRQDRSLATVGLTARQFIEFHGLNPTDVFVETCQNQPREDTIEFDPSDPGNTQGIQLGPTVEEDTEICTGDQRKLVRVTARVESPTFFLKLLGIGSIPLQASAISETAVLDVVIIMDVSESMLNETTYESWAEVGLGRAYVPPRLELPNNLGGPWADDTVGNPKTVFGRQFDFNGGPIPTQIFGGDVYPGPAPQPPTGAGTDWWADWFWQDQLLGPTHPQGDVNKRLLYDSNPGLSAVPAATDPDYPVSSFVPQAIINDPDLENVQTNPREACRVRFFPNSRNVPLGDYMEQTYSDAGITFGDTKWSGFVPTYNFYGCCNDPGDAHVDNNGVSINVTGNAANDGLFDDLVCQPFKQARDATRLFLEQIDFLRGDRVAFVTFDRTAFIIDPDGANGRPASLPEDNQNHMIETLDDARNTLNNYIGVRADPNFYVWNEDGGGWSGFAAGIDRASGGPIPINYAKDAGVNLGDPESVNYPVSGNCEFQNAALVYPWSRFHPKGSGQYPLARIMYPPLNASPWSGMTGAPRRLNPGDNAYELWAQCRGTNIGSALREAQSALTDPSTQRREGTVWVMVLLSDGAAGASDPVRLGGALPDEPEPYQQIPDVTGDGVQDYGVAGEYGFYGLCPPGDGTSTLGELVDSRDPSGTFDGFPFCSDENPAARHFCAPDIGEVATRLGEPNWQSGFRPNTLDLDGVLTGDSSEQHIYEVDLGTNYPNDGACDNLYDVDDYARDWADWVAGVREEAASSAAVLPTVFTIGFGLNFEDGSGTCEDNVEDCLGEELLRYIADAGDNFHIDNDYEEDWIDNGFLDDSVTDYGIPDPCQANPADFTYPDDAGSPINPANIQFRNSRDSCGNYFNAPGKSELEQVFEEIASRMFTRIAG